MALEISQDVLDLSCGENVGVSLGFGCFEGRGKECPAVGKDPAELAEDAVDGSVLETVVLHPENEGIDVLAVAKGLSVVQEGSVGMDGATLPVAFGLLVKC